MSVPTLQKAQLYTVCITKQLEYPMPARRGEMCFQTPMLPCRIF